MTAATPAPSTLVRPFTVTIPDSEIEDLKLRLARTRWPNAETVPDWSQGVRLENTKSLIDYWAGEYDWRRFESELNRFPQFLTEIDGLDIHFIHVTSKNPNAMPLILTHGWPGSIVEFLKLIGPLTDPVAFGGNVEDSFDVVVPSLPGFGFSQKPTETGWNVIRIATAWVELMRRLGYTNWAAQGGDWGSVVTSALGAMRPEGSTTSFNPRPTITGSPRTPSVPMRCSTQYRSTGTQTRPRLPLASTGRTRAAAWPAQN